MLGKSHAAVGASGFAISAATVATLSHNPDYTTPVVVASAAASAAAIGMSYVPKNIFAATSAPSWVKKRAPFVSASVRAFGWIIFAVFASVLVGALVYLTAPSLIPVGEAVPLITWALVTAGWALSPDIDEPGSTVSRFLGPVSRTFSKFVRHISGGHREMTHTWVFVALAFAFGLAASYVGGAFAAVTVAMSVCLSWGIVAPRSLRKYALIASIAIGALVYWGVDDLSPVVFAISYGTWLHILGDMATKSGVEFLWPSSRTMGWRAFSTVSIAAKKYEAKKRGNKGPSTMDYYNAYCERAVVSLYSLVGFVAIIIALAPESVSVVDTSAAASIISLLDSF